MLLRRLRSAYDRRANVGPGIRVGLAFENRPEFFFHFLAINACGGSILPLNSGLVDEELQYQIDHSEAALIVCADSVFHGHDCLKSC